MCGLLLRCTKTPHLLAFSSRGTYIGPDQIHKFVAQQFLSRLRHQKKKQKKNILWAQPQPRNIRGAKDWRTNLILKVSPSLPRWPGIMWLWFAVDIKYYSGIKQSDTVITARDLKQPECWLRPCFAPLWESVCKAQPILKICPLWPCQSYPHTSDIPAQ